MDEDGGEALRGGDGVLGGIGQSGRGEGGVGRGDGGSAGSEVGGGGGGGLVERRGRGGAVVEDVASLAARSGHVR